MIKIILVAQQKVYKDIFKNFSHQFYDNKFFVIDKSDSTEVADVVLINTQNTKKSIICKNVSIYWEQPIFLLSDNLVLDDFPKANIVGILPLETPNKFIMEIMLTYFSEYDDSPKEICAKLSTKEQLILRCLVEKKTNKQIARFYGLSLSSVKLHVQNIYKALGVKCRSEAVLIAQEISS